MTPTQHIVHFAKFLKIPGAKFDAAGDIDDVNPHSQSVKDIKLEMTIYSECNQPVGKGSVLFDVRLNHELKNHYYSLYDHL